MDMLRAMLDNTVCLKCWWLSVILSRHALRGCQRRSVILLRFLYSCRNDALDEICFRICTCNTVCDVMQGRAIGIQFNQLFLKPNKEKIDFLLEVRCES